MKNLHVPTLEIANAYKNGLLSNETIDHLDKSGALCHVTLNHFVDAHSLEAAANASIATHSATDPLYVDGSKAQHISGLLDDFLGGQSYYAKRPDNMDASAHQTEFPENKLAIAKSLLANSK